MLALGALKSGERKQKQYFPDFSYAEPTFNGSSLSPIGPDSGPEVPFPVKFQGKVVPGTGGSQAELGIPTANLGGVSPDDIKERLRGVYFGWASLEPSNSRDSPLWHQAVIAVGSSPYGRLSIAPKIIIAVHLFHEFGVSFVSAKLKVIAMGFLRSMITPGTSLQQRLDMVSRDVLLTVASLTRPNWGPEVAANRLRSVKSARSLGDRFVGTRERVQRRVENVPVHRLGVRTPGQEAKDEVYGRGGYWVAR